MSEVRQGVRAPLTADYVPTGNTLKEKLANLINACSDSQREWLQNFLQADESTRNKMLMSADTAALGALQAFSKLSN
jgi:hypothetical protein